MDMIIIKLDPETIKLFETLGNILNLPSRKAIFLPYIFVQHENRPPDEYQLIPLFNFESGFLIDYQDVVDPFIVKSDVA